MANKKLTDIAAREFADDEDFLVPEGSEQSVVVLSDNSRPAPADFPHELAANEPQADSPTSVDESLDVRRTVARKQG
jgi:hypothetical protein